MPQRIGQLRTIDIGNEVRPDAVHPIGFQRFGHHYRPEIRTADTYIDDIGKDLAAIAPACAAVNRGGKTLHLLSTRLTSGNTSTPSKNWRSLRNAICKAARCSVELILSPETCGNPVLQLLLLRQGQ